MDFVMSVSKGYEMLRYLLSMCPSPIRAIVGLSFAVFCVNPLAKTINWLLGGGGD